MPITIVGNLTNDPELRFTPSGAAVAGFSVAVNERRRNAQTQEWEDAGTSYYRVEAWRSLAENVAGSLRRGTAVVVTGEQTIEVYERKDGGTGTSVRVRAQSVGPDLRYATAVVQRHGRQDGSAARGAQHGPAAPEAAAPLAGAGAEDPWGVTAGRPGEAPF
ncbi:single-stranded DNA-binding protein [Kineococcus indalonis]|uniref:single-stranded DNA-binding protein n=1 Tax=Kineococcus indalonis TaxID=2696566 RepID=UPI00196ADA82|nr:single-stranded DNA-binding protein [Kineococcus indalonis]